MPVKKGKKRAKPRGEPHGQPGNKAKHKRLGKTTAMNEFNTLTRPRAVLNAEKEALAEVLKKIPEEKKKTAAEKQVLVHEQKQFARANKAFETKVARCEQATSAETVTPTNEACMTKLEKHKEWKDQEGGWKVANGGNLVGRAMKEINDWIEKPEPILGGKLGNLVISGWYKQQEDEPRDEVVESEGVGAELEIEESQGLETENPGDEDGDDDILFLAWGFMSSLRDLGF